MLSILKYSKVILTILVTALIMRLIYKPNTISKNYLMTNPTIILIFILFFIFYKKNYCLTIFKGFFL